MTLHQWPAEITALGNQIAALSATDAARLCVYLDEVHGIAGAAFTGQSGAEPEPDVLVRDGVAVSNLCAIWLESHQAGRIIPVIKMVRQLLGVGLKEAKDLVETAPSVLRERIPRTAAEQMRADLEAAGAQVSLR